MKEQRRSIRKPILFLAMTATMMTLAATGCAPSKPVETITVFAAASLRDVFVTVGRDFEARTPGVRVEFSFAGSQRLAEQIAYGAQADVFAPADETTMNIVVDSGRIAADAARVFAHNRLIVIVPQRNPALLLTLQDLARPGVTILLANTSVPVGRYSRDFLDKAAAQKEFGPVYRTAVLSNVVSYEEDVRAVFAKISLGEADAGIVYASDVVADEAKTVGALDIPAALNTTAAYPIAALADSPNPELARAFVEYVLSKEGRATLQQHGFVAP